VLVSLWSGNVLVYAGIDGLDVGVGGRTELRPRYVRVLLLRGEGGQAFTSNAEFRGWM
jgi:hypothetical protein